MKYPWCLSAAFVTLGIYIVICSIAKRPISVNIDGDVRVRIQKEASAVFHGVTGNTYGKDFRISNFNSGTPPAWWSEYYAEKLTPGVMYSLNPAVIGRPIRSLQPGETVVIATGQPVVHAFHKKHYEVKVASRR